MDNVSCPRCRSVVHVDELDDGRFLCDACDCVFDPPDRNPERERRDLNG